MPDRSSSLTGMLLSGIHLDSRYLRAGMTYGMALTNTLGVRRCFWLYLQNTDALELTRSNAFGTGFEP